MNFKENFVNFSHNFCRNCHNKTSKTFLEVLGTLLYYYTIFSYISSAVAQYIDTFPVIFYNISICVCSIILQYINIFILLFYSFLISFQTISQYINIITVLFFSINIFLVQYSYSVLISFQYYVTVY